MTKKLTKEMIEAATTVLVTNGKRQTKLIVIDLSAQERIISYQEISKKVVVEVPVDIDLDELEETNDDKFLAKLLGGDEDQFTVCSVTESYEVDKATKPDFTLKQWLAMRGK